MEKSELSPAASAALVNAGSNRQGADVPATPEVLNELWAAGLIGAGNGLTRAGSIYRQKMMTRLLDASF